MPSWFAAGFWNLLERNSPQADRCWLWPTGNPLIIRVSRSLLKVSIDSLLWACCHNLRKKCCGASLRSRCRDDFWMGRGWNRPSCSGCCFFPFPSWAKWALALGSNTFAFLPLAAHPIVSLGSTKNYFTLYSWVFVKSLHTLLRGYTTWK